MTKRFRRILFYLLTALFFVLAAAAIFYSNGWRFDMETFSISTLGGIYFEKIPDGATLTVEKIDTHFNPGFLKSSVLIANLFPKIYTAKAVKEGYQTWTKQISVQPSLVTEIDPIIMLSEKPASTTPLARNIRNFWVGPKYIIIQTMAGSLIFQSSKIAGTDVLGWSDDGQAVITSGNNRYYLIYLNNTDSALNLIPAFLDARKASGITDISRIKTLNFQPGKNSSLMIQTEKGLYLFNTERFTATAVSSKPVLSFAAHDREIIFSSEKLLKAYDSDSGIARTLALSEEPEQPVEIRYNDDGTYFTLRDAQGKLELINRRDLTSAVLARNAKKSFFAPNSMKLVFTTENNELVIYTLGKRDRILETPETEVLRMSGENEQTIQWHKNSAHLFMEYPDVLYLLEANNKPPINLQKIDRDVQKYFYDAEKNSIYLLKNNALTAVEME